MPPKQPEDGKVVRPRFLPRRRKQAMAVLGHHHVQPRERAEHVHHPVGMDFAVHNLAYVFNGVRH